MTDTNGNGEKPNGRNPLEHFREMMGVPVAEDFADIPTPTHWPTVPSADTAAEWAELRSWVEDLCRRFSFLDHHVIPRCWWLHNEQVEALAALKDHEQSSFSDSAPATAPVDWFRALRDVTNLLKAWTSEFSCGSTHQPPLTPLRPIDEADWQAFVEADLATRREREIRNSIE